MVEFILFFLVCIWRPYIFPVSKNTEKNSNVFEWILHENENLPNGENWAKKASTKFRWTDAPWKQAKKLMRHR